MAGEFPQSMREQTSLTAKTATDPDVVSCYCPGMERSLDVERIGIRMTGSTGLGCGRATRAALLASWTFGEYWNIWIFSRRCPYVSMSFRF